jgi:hypothetical protein
MKHPVIYRVVFYSIMLGLCVSIFFLLSLMQEAPFHTREMKAAYRYGCQIGSRPLNDDKITFCDSVADMFEQTLNDLDKQREEYVK